MATPVQPTAQNTHISADFGKLLEPGLRKIFFETYQEIPEQFSKVFNVKSSTRSFEEDYGLGAFGDWVERATELSAVAYEQIPDGLSRFYKHKPFTKGFMIGRELYDDEMYNQINKFPKALARAGRAKVEKDAVSLFVNGFSTDIGGAGKSAIYDGRPLFADNHPLLSSGKLGDNLVTGALSEANLKIAMQCMRETTDEAGNLIQFMPDTLVVTPKNEHLAGELTKSTHKPGTDFNDVNTLVGKFKVVVLDYLGTAGGGSDNMWFIMDSKRHEANFFWRTKPEFKHQEDFDTLVAKYRGYMRYSFGVSDWRGIVGSAGV